jgi:hypothetical protein
MVRLKQICRATLQGLIAAAISQQAPLVPPTLLQDVSTDEQVGCSTGKPAGAMLPTHTHTHKCTGIFFTGCTRVGYRSLTRTGYLTGSS